MGVGLGLGANDSAQAQAQAQVRVQGAGQDGFQFVPIETLAVEQLGGGAIRVSTPNGIQVLEAGQWLYANGQVMALQSALSQSASVAEAWTMQAPAIAASTAPVLVQLPTAPAAASVASTASLAPAAPVIATAAAPSLTQVGVVAGGATVASASVYAGYRLLSRDEASGNGATSASSTASGSPATDEDAASGAAGASEPEQQLNLPGHSSYFTGDLLVDSLLSEEESHWGGAGLYDTPATITYSFSDTGSALSMREGETVQPVPTFFKTKVREQLDELEALANLTFVEVPDTGSFNAATGEGRGHINITVTDDAIGNSYAVLPTGRSRGWSMIWAILFSMRTCCSTATGSMPIAVVR